MQKRNIVHHIALTVPHYSCYFAFNLLFVFASSEKLEELFNQKDENDLTPLDILLSDDVISATQQEVIVSTICSLLERGVDISILNDLSINNLKQILSEKKAEMSIISSLMDGAPEYMLDRNADIKAFKEATFRARMNYKDLDAHNKRSIERFKKANPKISDAEIDKIYAKQEEQDKIIRNVYNLVIDLISPRSHGFKLIRNIKTIHDLAREAQGLASLSAEEEASFDGLKYVASLIDDKGNNIAHYMSNNTIFLYSQKYAKSKKNMFFLLQQLSEDGLDLNKKNDKGTPVIVSAASSGRADIVSALVNLGADVNAKNANGANAFYTITSNNEAMQIIACLLLEKGAKFDFQTYRTGNLLNYAVCIGNPFLVSYAIKNGAVVNDYYIGSTALKRAYEYLYDKKTDNNIEIVRILEAAGARYMYWHNCISFTAVATAVGFLSLLLPMIAGEILVSEALFAITIPAIALAAFAMLEYACIAYYAPIEL